jgi:hypothetical protein
MIDLQNEIRINQKYTHLYSSEYNKSMKGESTPKINKKILLTPDYLRRMSLGFGSETPAVIPPNCRYMEKVNRGHIIIIEEPPAFRTININMGFHSEVDRLKMDGKLEEYGYEKNFAEKEGPRQFTLAFPYVIFLLYLTNYNELSGGQTFLRVARLAGLADYLLKIPLLNIAANQYICFGGKAEGRTQSLNAAVEKIISSFWASEFNTDYTYNYNAYSKIAGVHSYMEWQALSQSNPMFIYNVDWINIPMNIGQAIESLKQKYSITKQNDVQYQTLSNMFNQPLSTGKFKKPTPRSRKKFTLFYDIASGMYLDSAFYVHVGDPFYIKKGKSLCHINSFISFMDSGDIKYIRVERDDGKLITFKVTKMFKKYLFDETKKLRFEEKGILKNGVEIKENDILIIKNDIGTIAYKNVSFIRKSVDGLHEGRFGDRFYILENTEGEVFDTSNPKYEDIVLKKDKEYIYVPNLIGVPFQNGRVVKFNQITTARNQLSIEMKNESQSYNLNLGSTISKRSRSLYEKDELKPLPPVFRVGRRILSLKDIYRKELLHDKVFGSPIGVIYEGNSSTVNTLTPKEIEKYILEKDKFHIQSFDMDIEFNLGDKVVVADWKNPINMLSIKIIQGFKFESTTGDISFILADKEGNLIQEKYVEGSGGLIYVGRIRKITNKFGKLVAGAKIKAKESSIAQFPKKDVNIIIGFITDTGGPEPLVLCSNCCTLWYSDVLTKFQKTTIKSKKWPSLKHVSIDVSKIKYQPGDIIRGINDYNDRKGWFVFSNGVGGPKILDFGYFTSYADYYSLDKYITANSELDCIPNPRIGPKAQTSMGIVRSWPNLHGHFFTCESSELKLINEERSIVHVQSSSK